MRNHYIAEGTLIGALRGPLMLITLGVLLAADQVEAASFGNTWPALLILYGILWLLERMPRSGAEDRN